MKKAYLLQAVLMALGAGAWTMAGAAAPVTAKASDKVNVTCRPAPTEPVESGQPATLAWKPTLMDVAVRGRYMPAYPGDQRWPPQPFRCRPWA